MKEENEWMNTTGWLSASRLSVPTPGHNLSDARLPSRGGGRRPGVLASSRPRRQKHRQNLGAWLTTAVARICLDILRACKLQREESLEASFPSSITTEPVHPTTCAT